MRQSVTRKDAQFMMEEFGVKTHRFSEPLYWRKMFINRPPIVRVALVGSGIYVVRKYAMCRKARRHFRASGAMKLSCK